MQVALLGVVVLGLALRACPWLFPHTFTGVLEYDDGVYYAASRALLHGAVPYRDFTIVHPPLSAVVLLPFAACGAVFGDPAGMAAARVAWLLVAAVNIVLVYRLASGAEASSGWRRWRGLFAAALCAVFPASVIAEHTILLEPLTSLFALLGACWLLRGGTLRRRRLFLAGALIGAAACVKAFGCAYAVVAIAWLLATRRQVVWFVAGIAAVIGAVIGPLVVLAGPAAVWRDLVVGQLGRPSDGGVAAIDRLWSLTGTSGLPALARLALASAVVVLVVAGLRAGARPLATAWFWGPLAALIFIAFLRSRSYFTHYADFLAPPGAIGLSHVLPAPRRRLVHRALVVAAAGGVLAAAALGNVSRLARWHGEGGLDFVARDVPKRACLYYDAVSLAVSADRFQPPTQACPAWIDGRGQNLVWSGAWPPGRAFYPAGFLADHRWQAQTAEQLRRADFLLVRSDPTQMPEWNAQLRAYVQANFTLVRTVSEPGRIQLWRRTTRP
jgi:hypothetical protein